MNPNLKKGSKQKELSLTNTVIFKQQIFKPALHELSDKKYPSSNKSPYNEIMQKIRSESQLKMIQSTTSGIVSPLFGSSASISNPSKKISLKSALMSNSSVFSSMSKTKAQAVSFGNINEIMMTTYDKPNYYEATEKELIDLTRKLDKIEKLHNNDQITYEIFDKYKEIFEEVIEKDGAFGHILNKLKSVYDNWIEGKIEYGAENKKLKAEIVGLNKIIKEIKGQNIMFLEQISHISEENAKLGKDTEIKNEQYHSLQDYLTKIENTKSEGFTKDENTWKLLIAENKSYVELCETMKNDIKKMKLKEKQLMKLFTCLKIQGYPVDEIYKEKVKTKRRAKRLPSRVSSEDEDNITGTPTRAIIKPSVIPDLKLPICKQYCMRSLSSSSDVSCSDSYSIR